VFLALSRLCWHQWSPPSTQCTRTGDVKGMKIVSLCQTDILRLSSLVEGHASGTNFSESFDCSEKEKVKSSGI
jgi:hypothetical protein